MESTIYYIGVDPGSASGAAAVLGMNSLHVIPYTNPSEMCAWLAQWPLNDLRLAAVEAIGPMPFQAVGSGHKLSENYGIWQGIFTALAIPLILAPPKEWQKGMGLPKGSGPKEKKARKKKVVEYVLAKYKDAELHRLLKVQKNWGMADALCIAEYAARADKTLWELEPCSK